MLQLLRRVEDETERTKIVENLCATVANFTGRIRLLHAVGRRPNPEMERLIPVGESDRLFRQVCQELHHATVAQVAAERDPLRVLATALAEDPADREDIDRLLQDDACSAALLLSAPTQVHAQMMGSVAVQTEQVLRWEWLGTVVGDDKAIAALVEGVASARADDEAAMAVVALARKYLTGWRPSEFQFSGQEPVIRQASNHPHTFFSPPGAGRRVASPPRTRCDHL